MNARVGRQFYQRLFVVLAAASLANAATAGATTVDRPSVDRPSVDRSAKTVLNSPSSESNQLTDRSTPVASAPADASAESAQPATVVATEVASQTSASVASLALLGPVGVDPASITQSANPGATIGPITKTVHTPTIPPNPDIVLLIDQTTSMGPAIANVQAGLANILSTVVGSQPTAQFAVTDYKDQVDPAPVFNVRQPLTANQTDIQTAINNLFLTGGGTDAPEDFINGLFQIASGAITFRPTSTRFVVLVGDSSSHDPSNGHSMASTITALNAANIHVIAIDVGPTPGEISNGLNAAGQAALIATSTGGELRSGDASQASALILAALQNQQITVTHSVGPCDPNLSVSLTPASQTLVSGGDAVFSETINVSASAPQGATLNCTVEFLINGQSQGITQSIAITVNDVTPPVVTVTDQTVEATSPAGAVINYPVTAIDNVDGPVPFTCVPPPGSTFPIGATTDGVTTVTCTATDSAGNTGTGTGTMTVRDTTPPLLNLPAPIVVEATGPGGAIVDYTATATDIVDVTDPVTCVPPSGSLFPVGVGETTTVVTCTSTDLHGNTSTGTFTVTVRDTTPPATACPETTNPSGQNVPRAGANPKSGQNPDGFYLLEA
ncbi:MAG TPA: HYR domain-containing protein, partial [Ilumatobacteraceae bacterium]|nr:HYR domain-containing protein [Ilumatobacteraceae bacterium]